MHRGILQAGVVALLLMAVVVFVAQAKHMNTHPKEKSANSCMPPYTDCKQQLQRVVPGL